MEPELNGHAVFVMALILLALLLFAAERIRLQATALVVFVLLLSGFALWPYVDAQGRVLEISQLLSVFGNQALVTVGALMILGKGVEQTKALQPLVGVVSRNWSRMPKTTLLGVLVCAAAMSAFLNNTPIVVVMLPVMIAIAQKNHASPSKLLLPVGLATIIGGMATTIGTSTNLLVVDLAFSVADLEIGMFDFAPYILVAGSLGILYLWLIAPLLTPLREQVGSRNGDEREYMATLVIDRDAQLTTVKDLLARTHHDIAIDTIRHGDASFRRPLPSVALHPGDQVFVRGTPKALREAEMILKTRLRTIDNAELTDPELEPMVMEILVTERSELDGRSLRRSKLGEQYGIVAVAVHRPEARDRGKTALNRIRLRPRDILLCEGTRVQFDRLLAETRLLALTDPSELPHTQHSRRAVAIVVGVVAVAALDILPIAVSAIAGVGLMIASKCIAWRHVGQALSTQVVLVIVVSLALGAALMATGGDVYIAAQLANVLSTSSPAVTIAVLMLMMAVVTNIVTNNAAAVIGTPIGIQLAEQLAINPEVMVLAVLFGANLSFATPIGYQTNLLVFSAGGYKFVDFVRVGLPLTLLMWAVLTVLLVNVYGL